MAEIEIAAVEEYAMKLVTEGAESTAEDDMNEDGDIAEESHEEAVNLAIDMAHAIYGNPKGFLAWFKATQVE